MNNIFSITKRASILVSSLLKKNVETSASKDRSIERYRRILKTASLGVISKVVGLLVSLISVPLTVNYLGDERYGLWMAISSFISMLNFADLGLGNGLLTALSEANGKEDKDVEKQLCYISSTFFFLCLITVFLIISFIVINPFLDYQKIFNIQNEIAIKEAGIGVVILFIGFVINFPLGIISKIQLAYQEGHINYIWTIIGSFIGFLGVLIGIYYKGGLPVLILAIMAGPIMGNICNGILFIQKNGKNFLPSFKHVNWPIGKHVINLGLMFFYLQLLALVINNSDNLIIANLLGASEVTPYSITNKLFQTAQLANFIIVPLWPAFGEAVSRGDYDWAKKTLVRFILIAVLISITVSIPLVIFGNPILQIWTHTGIIVPKGLLVGFGLWTLISAYVGTLSTFMNQRDLLTRQISFFSLTAILAITSKIILVKKFGIIGAIWGSIISYGVFFIIPSAKLSFGFLRSKGKSE